MNKYISVRRMAATIFASIAIGSAQACLVTLLTSKREVT